MIDGTIGIPSVCPVERSRTFGEYASYLWQYVNGMFTWISDFCPSWVFERYLTTRGHCGIFYNGGDIVVAAGGYTGEPSRYGFGTKYIGADFTGKTYTGTVGKDVVVLWNNDTLTNDLCIISSYAKRFVETDKSILNVLRGARITALVTAADNTDSITLDKVVNAIKDGDTVVKIPPVYREIDALDNGVKRFDIIRLTDPKDTDKLQYLCRYRDDLLANFLREYGLDVDMVNKGSQITSDELHSMVDAVSAVVVSRYQCRARDLDIVRGWGHDIDVKIGVGRGGNSDGNNRDNDTRVDNGGMDTDTDNVGEYRDYQQSSADT